MIDSAPKNKWVWFRKEMNLERIVVIEYKKYGKTYFRLLNSWGNIEKKIYSDADIYVGSDKIKLLDKVIREGNEKIAACKRIVEKNCKAIRRASDYKKEKEEGAF